MEGKFVYLLWLRVASYKKLMKSETTRQFVSFWGFSVSFSLMSSNPHVHVEKSLALSLGNLASTVMIATEADKGINYRTMTLPSENGGDGAMT